MGLAKNAVHLLSRTLSLMGDLSDKKVLVLGVQDCYFTYPKLIAFLNRHGIAHVPVPPGEVLRTTGFRYLPESERSGYADCVHQKTLLRTLGFAPVNIVSLDYSGFEGADLILDLNEPVPEHLHGQFDLVVDGGTIEHVFSVKDSLFNVARFCKVGGYVVHFSPADYLNHGFVNLNAEVFRAFYSANGFQVNALKYIALPNHPGKADEHYLEFEPSQLPFSLQPFYSIMLYGSYRKTLDQPPRVPQQGSYEEMWKGSAQPSFAGRGPLLQKLRRWANRSWVATELILPFMVRRRGKKVRL
jgi:hypothetical protein